MDTYSKKDTLLLGSCTSDDGIQLNVESYMCLFLLSYWESLSNYEKSMNLDVKIVLPDDQTEQIISSGLQTSFKFATFQATTVLFEDLPWELQQSTFPVFQVGIMFHCGLCAVSRALVKVLDKQLPSSGFRKLLGHKEVCLKACSEVSKWAKFCEVDLPQATVNFLKGRYEDSLSIFTNLDSYFDTPVVIANITKRMKEVSKLSKMSKKDSSSKVSTLTKEMNDLFLHNQMNKSDDILNSETSEMELATQPTQISLQHVFVEGPDLTLTDVLTWPCIDWCKKHNQELFNQLTNLQQWYDRMMKLVSVKKASDALHNVHQALISGSNFSKVYHGLRNYYSQPIAQSTECGQNEVAKKNLNSTLSMLQELDLGIKNEGVLDNSVIDWSVLPREIHPAGGKLPSKRVDRKCQQLENLAIEVKKLNRKNCTIVDFCSGGGHLGILLAYLLPDCKVLLLENKEESLKNASDRINSLSLKNVFIYQCNLGHFVGQFDIGTTLHACGSATDLVLEKCLSSKAAFVICPCCYGAIENKHTVCYPRSRAYKASQVAYEDYKQMAQSADHPTLGKQFMNIIDIDRLKHAEENGYLILLKTLNPESCSPKNNLLVGKI